MNYVFNRWDDGTGFAAGRAMYGPNAWFGRTFDSGRPLMDYPSAYPRLAKNFNYVSAQNSYVDWDPLRVQRGYASAPPLTQAQQGVAVRDAGIPGSPIGYQQILMDANGRPVGGLPASTPTFYRTGPIQPTYTGFAVPVVQSTVAYDAAVAQQQQAQQPPRAANPNGIPAGPPVIGGSGPFVTEATNAGALFYLQARPYGVPMQAIALEPGDTPIYGSPWPVQRASIPIPEDRGVATQSYGRANNPKDVKQMMMPTPDEALAAIPAPNPHGVPYSGYTASIERPQVNPGGYGYPAAAATARRIVQFEDRVSNPGQIMVRGQGGGPATRTSKRIAMFGQAMANPSALPGPFHFATQNPGGYGYPSAQAFAQRVTGFMSAARNPTYYGQSYANMLQGKIRAFDGLLANPKVTGYGLGEASRFASSVGQWERRTMNPAYGNVGQEHSVMHAGVASLPAGAYGFPAARAQAVVSEMGAARFSNPAYGNVGQERRMQHRGVAQMPQAFGTPAAQKQAVVFDSDRVRRNPYGYRAARMFAEEAIRELNPFKGYGYRAAAAFRGDVARELNPSAVVVNPGEKKPPKGGCPKGTLWDGDKCVPPLVSGDDPLAGLSWRPGRKPLGLRRRRFSGQRARMTAARFRNPGACCDACAEGKACTGCAIPNPGCGCGQKRI